MRAGATGARTSLLGGEQQQEGVPPSRMAAQVQLGVEGAFAQPFPSQAGSHPGRLGAAEYDWGWSVAAKLVLPFLLQLKTGTRSP